MSETKANEESRQTGRNRTVAVACVSVVAGMVGMAYAAVPLYELFCQVTGYGGTTQRADSASETVIDREIVVRFDANVSGALGWQFKPKQREIRLKIGETGRVDYVAANIGKALSTGTSTFNVTPELAGSYFNKLECFCFTEQELKSGESVDMPVVFFVDPDIDKDSNLKSVKTITLSYTFFAVPNRDKSFAEGGSSQTNRKQL